jgi:hypothetical protein
VVADLALLNDLIDSTTATTRSRPSFPSTSGRTRLVERGAPWRPLPSVTAADLLAGRPP